MLVVAVVALAVVEANSTTVLIVLSIVVVLVVAVAVVVVIVLSGYILVGNLTTVPAVHSQLCSCTSAVWSRSAANTDTRQERQTEKAKTETKIKAKKRQRSADQTSNDKTLNRQTGTVSAKELSLIHI